MKKMILIFFFAVTAWASNPVHLGIYAGAPIIHDSIAFELLPDGKAIITTDYFEADGQIRKAPCFRVVVV